MDSTLHQSAAYAGLITRVAAYTIDIVLLFAGIAVSQGILRGVNPLLNSTEPIAGRRLHLWVLTTVSLPILLYFALLISSHSQATIGMRLLHISVTSLGGTPIGFGRAVLRSLVMLIPFELNHVVMFYPAPIWTDPRPGFRYGFLVTSALMILYPTTILVTQNHQSIHDLIAGTTVISRQ